MTLFRNHLTRAAALAALIAPALDAQIASRVEGAAAGAVSFTYAARPGVCGNGRTWIMTGNNSFTGSFTSTDMARTEPCQNGPVRVVIDRAGREVISIQAYVGDGQLTTGAQDLRRGHREQARG